MQTQLPRTIDFTLSSTDDGKLEGLFRGSFAGVVDVAGDLATVRRPCVETGVFREGDGRRSQGYDNRAVYEDRHVRVGDGWRLRHRRHLYLWLSNDELPAHAVPLGEEIA